MRRAHHDLLAWQQRIELVKVVYQLTEALPRTEIHALTNQMRRAAVSVPANIAEGAKQIDRVFGLLGGLINSHRKSRASGRAGTRA